MAQPVVLVPARPDGLLARKYSFANGFVTTLEAESKRWQLVIRGLTVGLGQARSALVQNPRLHKECDRIRFG